MWAWISPGRMTSPLQSSTAGRPDGRIACPTFLIRFPSTSTSAFTTRRDASIVTTRRADLADELAAFDRVTNRDERPAQMVIDRHDAVAVVHEHGDAAVEEIADERHDTAIRDAHGRALRAGNIQPIMPAPPGAVDLPSGAEHAGDARRPRPHELLSPESRHLMRPPCGIAEQSALLVDPDLERAVGRRREALGGAHLFVGRHLARPHADGHRMADDGAVPANRERLDLDAVARRQRHSGQSFAVAEMQRLTGDLPRDRAGSRYDHELTLPRRCGLPGDVLGEKGGQHQQHHVETRGLVAVLSLLGGKSKYASTSSSSSSSAYSPARLRSAAPGSIKT